MAYSFRFLDDIAVADVAFEARGDSLEEVFRGATEALLETLADPATVGAVWEQRITKTDEDPADLLFDWLSDIVYWKDAAGVVFHEAPIALLRQGANWSLTARLIGAPVDRETQELRNDVKGITKHLYQVVRDGDCWKAWVVLDV